eukprot:5555354-Prorocentrum_lima.AAC.1
MQTREEKRRECGGNQRTKGVEGTGYKLKGNTRNLSGTCAGMDTFPCLLYTSPSPRDSTSS